MQYPVSMHEEREDMPFKNDDNNQHSNFYLYTWLSVIILWNNSKKYSTVPLCELHISDIIFPLAAFVCVKTGLINFNYLICAGHRLRIMLTKRQLCYYRCVSYHHHEMPMVNILSAHYWIATSRELIIEKMTVKNSSTSLKQGKSRQFFSFQNSTVANS
jgi:hypothetical protein